MAEIFSIVSGSLTVVGLFNDLVDCFEYIELGRNFGAEFQTCQLRLDITQLQLSRCGAAVDVNNNPVFADIKHITEESRTALGSLEQLAKLLQQAYTQSDGFK